MAKRMRRVPARKKRGIIQRYFVPGTHNNHQPRFLEFQAIAINVAIVIFLFLIALGVQSLVIRSPSPQVGAVVAAVLVDLANADRSLEGLSQLGVNPVLQEAAQMKADDMARKGYFAHQSPEGVDPWHWFSEAGYDFRFAGENLAVYFSDSAEVEKAWMNSPSHRANIMSDKFTEVGIAIAQGSYQGNETTFVVQMFGTPAPTAASGPSQAGAAGITSTSVAASSVVAGASAEALEVIVEDDTFIAVKRGGETLAAVSDKTQPVGALKDVDSSPNPLLKLLTSPKTTLQYVYASIAALVLFVLVLLFATGIRHLHVPSLIRGLGLLALIGFLLWSSSIFSGTLAIL